MKNYVLSCEWILIRLVGIVLWVVFSLEIAPHIPQRFFPYNVIFLFISLLIPIWFPKLIEYIHKKKYKIPQSVWESFQAKGFLTTAEQKQEIEDAFWDFIEIHKGRNNNYTMPSYVLDEFILSYQKHNALFEKMTHQHLKRTWRYEANPDFRDFKFRRDRKKLKHFKLRKNHRMPAYLRTYHALKKKGRGGGSGRLPDVFLLDWTLENLGGVAYSLREILHIKENYHPHESFKTSEMATTALISGIMLEQLFKDYDDDDAHDYEPEAKTDPVSFEWGNRESDSSSGSYSSGSGGSDSSWSGSDSSSSSSDSHDSSSSYDSYDDGGDD